MAGIVIARSEKRTNKLNFCIDDLENRINLLGKGTSDLRKLTSEFGKRTNELGKGTNDLRIRTSDLGKGNIFKPSRLAGTSRLYKITLT